MDVGPTVVVVGSDGDGMFIMGGASGWVDGVKIDVGPTTIVVIVE